MPAYRGFMLNGAATAYTFFWAGLLVRLRRPRVIGITGTVGKTTTKEVVAALLRHPRVQSTVGPIWKTPGNMNDNDGLPLAVLGFDRWPESRREFVRWLVKMPLRVAAFATIRPYPRVLVLEFAASSDGDVGALARVAPPSIAVVTTVGPSHLERFGTIERVADEKAALVRALPRDGLALLGADSSHATAMENLTRARTLLVPGAGHRFAKEVARRIGEALGVPPDALAEALAQEVTVTGRQQRLAADGLTIINDAFNANPMSMRYGIDQLDTQAEPGQRRVLILGDMAELGAGSERFHEEIGDYARARGDLLIGVGTDARGYRADHWYPTAEACIASLPSHVRRGDIVFVKASQLVRLQQVAHALAALAPTLPNDAHAALDA